MATVNINIWTSFNPSYIVLDYFSTNFLFETPSAPPENPIFYPLFLYNQPQSHIQNSTVQCNFHNPESLLVPHSILKENSQACQ